MASARRFAAQPRGGALLLLFLLASSLIGMGAGDPDKTKAQRKVRPAAAGSVVLFCCCCSGVVGDPLSLCWCWSGSLRRSTTEFR